MTKDDLISRKAAIDALTALEVPAPTARHLIAIYDCEDAIKALPSAQPEVIPHRNYKYLSDYWCECGWHLGKKGEVKYCAECGRKVNWHG